MKFKDIEQTQVFTWFRDGRNLTGVKVGDRQAFCFNDLCLHDLHANQTVKEPEPVPESLSYKVGHDGRAFLCSPIPGGKWIARCILLLTVEIMHERDFKTVESPRKAGEDSVNMKQVYIMLNLFEKKLLDLETAFRMVKMMLEDGLSDALLDNDIMSTYDELKVFIKPRE